jgi:hypothetical protein
MGEEETGETEMGENSNAGNISVNNSSSGGGKRKKSSKRKTRRRLKVRK